MKNRLFARAFGTWFLLVCLMVACTAPPNTPTDSPFQIQAKPQTPPGQTKKNLIPRSVYAVIGEMPETPGNSDFKTMSYPIGGGCSSCIATYLRDYSVILNWPAATDRGFAIPTTGTITKTSANLSSGQQVRFTKYETLLSGKTIATAARIVTRNYTFGTGTDPELVMNSQAYNVDLISSDGITFNLAPSPEYYGNTSFGYTNVNGSDSTSCLISAGGNTTSSTVTAATMTLSEENRTADISITTTSPMTINTGFAYYCSRNVFYGTSTANYTFQLDVVFEEEVGPTISISGSPDAYSTSDLVYFDINTQGSSEPWLLTVTAPNGAVTTYPGTGNFRYPVPSPLQSGEYKAVATYNNYSTIKDTASSWVYLPEPSATPTPSPTPTSTPTPEPSPSPEYPDDPICDKIEADNEGGFTTQATSGEGPNQIIGYNRGLGGGGLQGFFRGNRAGGRGLRQSCVRRNRAKTNDSPKGKGGGKNDKHASQRARDAALKHLEKAKETLKKLLEVNPRTPATKKQIEAAKKQVNHWKRKVDFTGENHSQGGGKGPK